MRYTVIAVPSADDALMRFWNESTNKAELTAAADRIDVALKNDPETKGICCEGLFILRDPPLVAVYEVIPEDRLVRIVSFALLSQP